VAVERFVVVARRDQNEVPQLQSRSNASVEVPLPTISLSLRLKIILDIFIQAA